MCVRASISPMYGRRKVKEEKGSATPKTPVIAEKESAAVKKKGINWANSPVAISNFNASYAFTESDRRNINIVQDHRLMHKASLNYNYQTRPKNIEPFSNFITSDYLALLRDFNFYYLPSKVSVRTEVTRQLKPCRCATP